MGASFWYKALGDLLRLRSLVTQKDDQQRADRQTHTAPTATGDVTAPAVPDVLRGERGDLNAIG
jgi:hypothetical protein